MMVLSLAAVTVFALANMLACETTQSGAGAPAKPKMVVRCDQALGLDAAAASRKDWGGTSEWSAAARGDTLELTRKGRCGDECGYEEKIVFSLINDDCPALVSASVTRIDRGEGESGRRVKEAVEGTLEIQDWNPSGGIVSGRLQSAQFTLVFHVKTSPPVSDP